MRLPTIPEAVSQPEPALRRPAAAAANGQKAGGRPMSGPLMFLLLLAAGCIGSAPGKALHETASALERKDSAAFLDKLDTGRYAAAYMDNLTQSNPAIRILDDMAGKFLGKGVGDVVNSITSVEEQLKADFLRRVSTGELENQCSRAASSECLWVPASLRAARIKELDADSAVAHVTVPGNTAGWLALAKIRGAWKIVGLSAREDLAVKYARTPPLPPADGGKTEL